MSADKPVVLYHHPYSRAANVVWMLEELGAAYELRFIDIMKGEQRQPEFRKINPMGKLPVIVHHDTVITESAAIGLYLADTFGLGSLAPKLDDPARGTYLRWSLYPSAVIEPGCMAKASDWKVNVGAAGFGDYESMLTTMEAAMGAGPWLLGERFTMADVIFGGTVRYMLQFKLIEARPHFVEYADRLSARPASQASKAKNDAIIAEHGLASS